MRPGLAIGVALAALGGCSGTEPTGAPRSLIARPFENRSPGEQLGYLSQRLPETCMAEAATVPELRAHEGQPRVEVSGSFRVQAESLTVVANWVDRQTGRSGGAEVHRRFGADTALVKLVQRELAQRLLISVLPQNWRLRLQLGETLRGQRLFGEARKSFREAVERAPTDRDRAAARFHVGKVSEELGDADTAISAYERALADHERSHSARFNLACLLFDRGDAARARALLRQSYEFRPDDPEVSVALAQIAAADGDFEGALRLYGRALALAPREPLYRVRLAHMLMRLERYAQAMKQFSLVRATYPTHQGALYGMGLAAARMGQVERAREYLGDFIAQARRHPSYAEQVVVAQDELARLGG